MSIDFLLLRTLHRMLRQQSDLREQIERLPRKLNQARANQARFEERLEAIRDELKQTRLKADQKQLQLDSREAKIVELKGKRNSCESNREYQLLSEQIAADEQANSVQSDEILELLEAVDVLDQRIVEARGHLEKAGQETARVEAAVTDEMSRLEGELARVSTELAEAEKRLPSDIAVEYRRLVAASGEGALSETDRETCGNCYRTLTRQIVDEILMQKPVFCQGCGALMYYVQPSSATN